MVIGIDASRAFAKERSGVGEYARELIEALVNKNHIFSNRKIILFVKPGQDVASFSEKLPSNWSFRVVRFFPLFWSQLGLVLAARFSKVNVLFSPSHALPLLFNKKTIYVLHGLEMKEVPSCYPFFRRLINKWLLKKSLAKADKVLAVSATTLKKAMEFYGTDREKIQVVYQGANVIHGRELVSQTKITIETCRMIKQPYLICVGNLEARKNIKGLVKAFNLVKRKRKNLKLLLLGIEGYGYTSIQQEINNSNWRQDIRKVGYLNKEEKEFLIKHAQCLACVSFAEGFGRTILEALLLGTPVVASKIEVFSELYAGKVHFADPNNPREIATAIDKALDKKKKSQSNKIKEIYNWDKIAVKVGKELISFDKK